MLKFIIITILIFMFLRLVAPFLLRFLLGMFLKKSMRNGAFFTNMNQQRPQPNNGNYSSNGRKPGDVKIDYIPNQPGQKDFKGGEYVDYEEVK
ncbi:DUF4834 family protein [Pontibacter sp. Tf4]|uniref:DUF4834 family protein n=1 Tax=Pontibacter sp. Tf4 TaxID=2761620 RepID=UPI0016267A66|nr:DUF4834 family protein [Pontibacter sp. Tf4]MBB6609955.1 DUF4834 family protein [Pontibacter sp. Tf4]